MLQKLNLHVRNTFHASLHKDSLLKEIVKVILGMEAAKVELDKDPIETILELSITIEVAKAVLELGTIVKHINAAVIILQLIGITVEDTKVVDSMQQVN